MKRPIENYDKLIHFAGGFIVASVITPLFGVLAALGVVTFLALGKEVYDYFHENHAPCGLDFIVTVCGGMFAAQIWMMY